MQTNYRSNQEILDFANKVLSNIEANQYANLRLRANSLAATTTDSFKTKVNLHYERVNKISDIDSKLPHIIAANAAPYLDEKYKNKEKVAFLAYTRRDVDRFKSILPTCTQELILSALFLTKSITPQSSPSLSSVIGKMLPT